MKYFYLELNALIEIGNRLKELNKNKAFIYTSSWALMEQYVNLNNNNYNMVMWGDRYRALSVIKAYIYRDMGKLLHFHFANFNDLTDFSAVNRITVCKIHDKVAVNKGPECCA